MDYFSFTTDAWSACAGTASLLSLTAHWLTDDFTRISAVLHVQPLEDSHTHLGGIYKKMLEGWGISDEKVHLVLQLIWLKQCEKLHFVLLGALHTHCN